jgi:hypothetical protein
MDQAVQGVPGSSPVVPDFTAMDGPALLEACGADAAKWAAAFCQHAKKLGHGDIDEGWMICWFANAIMHSHDVFTGNRVRVLPDGSAFFVGTVG